MQVTVLGTGNGSLACAGDLALAGHCVRLWGRRREALVPLATGDVPGPGRVEVAGPDRRGLATLDVVTLEPAEAIAGADVVLVPLPAFSHEQVMTAVAPSLSSGQTIVFAPGNLTSPLSRAVIDRVGGTGLRLVEAATLPYGARRAGEHGVVVVARNRVLPVAALTATETPAAVDLLRPLFPQVQPAIDVLDTALLNPNVAQHPALVVTNAGPLSGPAPYDIHAQGTTPGTLRLIHRIDEERIAVRMAAGYGPPHYPQRAYYDDPNEPWLFEAGSRHAVESSDRWREAHGLEHRYLLEDAAYGLSLVARMGRLTQTPTPASDAVLRLATTLLGLDLDPDGRWGRLGLEPDLAGFQQRHFGRALALRRTRP